MNNESDNKLNEELAKLPRTIEPARDLWPGIAARIARRSITTWPGTVLNVTAAAAVVAIAVAVTWLILPMHAPAPGNQSAATTVPANRDIATETVDLLARFTVQLASDTNLPPKARAALLDNLHMVHADILHTEAALKKYPNDVNLRALLFNLYQQQAQLMNEAQQAQIQTTARTEI
ncbi:MAG: hypothetical protein ACRETA_12865 [Gammaproteobacteria bacterium]